MQLFENLNESSPNDSLTTDSMGFFILEQQNQKIEEDTKILYAESEELKTKIIEIEE